MDKVGKREVQMDKGGKREADRERHHQAEREGHRQEGLQRQANQEGLRHRRQKDNYKHLHLLEVEQVEDLHKHLPHLPLVEQSAEVHNQLEPQLQQTGAKPADLHHLQPLLPPLVA